MSTPTSRTEHRTYRGPAETGAPRLAGLAGVRDDETSPQEVLETERHDTDDRRLTAAGITLALVRDDEQAVWQLDLPDGEQRERLRVPLAPDAGPSPTVPAELIELVRGVTRGRAVAPVAQVRTVRTTTQLLSKAGRVLAEVVHDHLTLATMGRSTEVASWTEIKVRAAPGARLEEIERRIGEAGLRAAPPAASSELDRALAPPQRVRRAGREGSAGAVLVEYLAAQADRLDAEDLRVRRGEPDSVHQLRVASRRLRSALQAFRPLLDRTHTDALVAELRDFGQELAPARDAEVLHERISAGLAELEPELLLGPVQAQVTRHFARIEAEAGAAVLSALDGERFAQLRSGLDALLERPPLTKRARRPAKTELPALVGRTARRLERAVQTATDLDEHPHERDLAVHDARKAGKRLRYATEVAQPAVGKPAKKFAKALKKFQTALGEHQDTVVAREALRELGALSHSAGENGFSFGVLHGRDAATAARIEQELPALWAAAWTTKSRKWLG